MAESSSKGFIKPIENLFLKLPPLPKSANEFIVSITPWLALILGIIGVIGSLSAFGLSTVFSPLILLGGGVKAATGLIAVAVISLIASVLMVVAVPSLFKKKAPGWTPFILERNIRYSFGDRFFISGKPDFSFNLALRFVPDKTVL
ncbi:MAG: hypothetical protein M1268_02695 [Patescibacteria group bacterium]|nr:hypothetical protein [Patescibacteria group bacterium]